MDRLPSLSHLFTSNHPPGVSEVALIDSVVETMDETIANLTAQLDKIKDERQRCRALLSPVRRIPMDVLGEVFGHAVDFANVRSRGHDMAQPVVLCLVCKTWRDAAYATHRLWASVDITIFSDWHEWNRAERWLHLSGAVPKNISVYSGSDLCSPSRTGQSGQCLLSNPRLRKLLAEGPDIRTLSISCANSQCMYHLCQAIQSIAAGEPSSSRPWDRIDFLKISVRTAWTEFPSSEYSTQYPAIVPGDNLEVADNNGSFLRHLPPVKSFHLDTPSQLFGGPCIPIPHASLSHLTTLSLNNDWDGCAVVKILRLCHGNNNLQELVFGCKSASVEHLSTGDDSEALWAMGIWGNTDKMFVLPKLRVLRFWSLHPDAFRITQFFKAPSLVELELGFDYVEDRDIPSEDNANLYDARGYGLITDLPHFIERSACNTTLRHLAFYGNLRLEIDDLKLWLNKILLPALSHLTFDGVYLPRDFFDCLRYRSRSRTLPLDHLKIIELLNLPTELHSLGLHLRDARQAIQPWDRAYLADTSIVVTIKKRDG